MKRKEEKVGKLIRWILVETYRSGLPRLNRNIQPGESRTEKPEGYSIHRHEIYRRYFRLPKDPFRYRDGALDEVYLKNYGQRRLRNAVILCESVRELLKNGLIQFPRGGVFEETQADLFGDSANFISLTEAGIKEAESILTLGQGPGNPLGEEVRFRHSLRSLPPGLGRGMKPRPPANGVALA